MTSSTSSITLARRVALRTLERIRSTQSFSNLLLPKLLQQVHASHQEAAFATELVYGTQRWQGLIDAIIAHVARRPVEDIDPLVLDIVRIGVYQLCWMTVPNHAVISQALLQTRRAGVTSATSMVNRVLRTVSNRDLQEWQMIVVSKIPKEQHTERLSVRYSHPEWIVKEFEKTWQNAHYDSWAAQHPECVNPVADMLAADNQVPSVTLVARPSVINREELLLSLQQLLSNVKDQKIGEVRLEDDSVARNNSEHTAVDEDNNHLHKQNHNDYVQGEEYAAFSDVISPTLYSPYGVRCKGIHPESLPLVRSGIVGVEDEGSQLAVLALVNAPLGDSRVLRQHNSVTNENAHTAVYDEHYWLDLCAGPGGKTALLAAFAKQHNVQLFANEPNHHRAELVRDNLRAFADIQLEQVSADGVNLPLVGGVSEEDGQVLQSAYRYDRILVDAPCSGLGALRRRPESRWRKSREALQELVPLQESLLSHAVDLLAPGGVIAYVTCSPAVEETTEVVDRVCNRFAHIERLSTTNIFAHIAPQMPLPDGKDVQLFAHLHNTDQMFISILRSTLS